MKHHSNSNASVQSLLASEGLKWADDVVDNNAFTSEALDMEVGRVADMIKTWDIVNDPKNWNAVDDS